MNVFSVFLTQDAANDLKDLYEYIDGHDAPGKADYVLSQIETSFNSLSSNPLRGIYPKELLFIGIKEYREIFFKPYRIIYKVIETKVFVMVIMDGRRSFDALLKKRLLTPTA